MNGQTNRSAVPFDGQLGNELRKLWDALRQNKISQGIEQRVSRLSHGTIIESLNPKVVHHAVENMPIRIQSAVFIGDPTTVSDDGDLVVNCTIADNNDPVYGSVINGVTQTVLIPFGYETLRPGVTRFMVMQPVQPLALNGKPINYVAINYA